MPPPPFLPPLLYTGTVLCYVCMSNKYNNIFFKKKVCVCCCVEVLFPFTLVSKRYFVVVITSGLLSILDNRKPRD